MSSKNRRLIQVVVSFSLPQTKPKEMASNFNTVFGTKTRSHIVADIGATANIMESDLINYLEKSSADFKIEILHRPVDLNMAAESHDATPSKLICTKLIKLNIDMHIHYGNALTLQNMEVYVRK